MVAHLWFLASSLVDSEGFIYGECLLNFHVRLPFCDTEDMLLLFPVDWWFPGASLLFTLFFCVCGYIWCDILSSEERPFSLMNNTSPSHPETREQTDCCSKGITGTPFHSRSWQLCLLPASLAPVTSPLPLSLLMDSFSLSHLAVPIVWVCCWVHRAGVSSIAPWMLVFFLCLKCKLHLNNDLELLLNIGFYSSIKPHWI